jgi:flagellar biogenesis protein FliO
MFSRKTIFLLLACVTASAALGADAPTLQSGPSAGAALVRMIGSLAFVVALFFGGAWLFRNMHRFRVQNGPQRKLHVLEARSLGARQALYVVGFDQQRFLVGAGPQGLTLLTHLPDGDAQSEPQRIVSVPFGDALLQALGRK